MGVYALEFTRRGFLRNKHLHHHPLLLLAPCTACHRGHAFTEAVIVANGRTSRSAAFSLLCSLNGKRINPSHWRRDFDAPRVPNASYLLTLDVRTDSGSTPSSSPFASANPGCFPSSAMHLALDSPQYLLRHTFRVHDATNPPTQSILV